MEQKEMQLLISAGVLDEAVIFMIYGHFELWLYGDGYLGNNVLKTQRKDVRTFASADAALSVLLSCGFKGKITVDRAFQ